MSNSNHLPLQKVLTFYKTFLQILLNPKEAIYTLSCCSLALCQPVLTPPSFFLHVLCSPHSSGFALFLLIEGELTELTSFTASFLLSHLPPSPSSLQSLPEKTEPDGVYDLITAWTHSWLLPPSDTHTHTESQQRVLVWGRGSQVYLSSHISNTPRLLTLRRKANYSNSKLQRGYLWLKLVINVSPLNRDSFLCLGAVQVNLDMTVFL